MLENFILPFLKRSKLLNVRTVFILCYIYNHSKPQFVKSVIDFYFYDKEIHLKELEEVLIDILQVYLYIIFLSNHLLLKIVFRNLKN